MTIKHTPGLWIAPFWPKNKDAIFVTLSRNEGHTIADCKVDGVTEDIARANAKLIAAAPELLEALQKIYGNSTLTGDVFRDFAQTIANKAINKATTNS